MKHYILNTLAMIGCVTLFHFALRFFTITLPEFILSVADRRFKKLKHCMMDFEDKVRACNNEENYSHIEMETIIEQYEKKRKKITKRG